MNKRQRGLTLVELMVTVAVAIVLLAVGVPLFTGVVANNRAAAQANSLVAAVKLARSEAVKRGADVSIAATDGSSWVNGWTVFDDANSNGSVDSGEELRAWGQIGGAAVAVTGTAPPVVFDRNGAANGAFNFNVTRSDASGPLSRCITVSASGQVRTKKQTASTAWSCP